MSNNSLFFPPRSCFGQASRVRRSRLLAAVTLSVLSLASGAGAAELWPQTKVRLTVIQWVPMKGIYERLEALSGEYIVSANGTMPLPVVGQITTGDKSSNQIASEVAQALKERLGLVNLPDTSIEIVSYPPVYVVGEVATPGGFEYRPGMSVLQAFAMSGGMRQDASVSTADRLRLTAELRSLNDSLLRGHARIARLKAEADGLETIQFSQEVTKHPDHLLAQEAMTEEQTILAARERQLLRQGESLEELDMLLHREIDTLKTRLQDVEQAIAITETELSGVQSLVEKGIVTVSRRTDLERQVADLRFDRLTQTTAILRAQQTLNQTKREALQLEDSRTTEGALALQDEQAKLNQLLLQQSTAQRLLLEHDSSQVTASGQEPALQYTIVRQSVGGAEAIAADETTVLLPGDVLKVGTAPVPAGVGPQTATALVRP